LAIEAKIYIPYYHTSLAASSQNYITFENLEISLFQINIFVKENEDSF
jgi:hypothetical protein